MRRTYRTLNDCEMQHNAEVGLFTRPSYLDLLKAEPDQFIMLTWFQSKFLLAMAMSP